MSFVHRKPCSVSKIEQIYSNFDQICHTDKGNNEFGDLNVDDVACSLFGTSAPICYQDLYLISQGAVKYFIIQLKKNANTAWCSAKQKLAKRKDKANVHHVGQEILDPGPPPPGQHAHYLKAIRMFIETDDGFRTQFGLTGSGWKTSANVFDIPYGPHHTR